MVAVEMIYQSQQQQTHLFELHIRATDTTDDVDVHEVATTLAASHCSCQGWAQAGL